MIFHDSTLYYSLKYAHLKLLCHGFRAHLKLIVLSLGQHLADFRGDGQAVVNDVLPAAGYRFWDTPETHNILGGLRDAVPPGILAEEGIGGY